MVDQVDVAEININFGDEHKQEDDFNALHEIEEDKSDLLNLNVPSLNTPPVKERDADTKGREGNSIHVGTGSFQQFDVSTGVATKKRRDNDEMREGGELFRGRKQTFGPSNVLRTSCNIQGDDSSDEFDDLMSFQSQASSQMRQEVV